MDKGYCGRCFVVAVVVQDLCSYFQNCHKGSPASELYNLLGVFYIW